MNQAQAQYIDMVRRDYPQVYSAAIRQVKEETGETLGVDWSGMFSSFTDAVKNVAPQLLQLKQQRDLLKAQTERAKKGLPPIADTASYNVSLPVEATQGYGAYNVETRIAGIPLKYLLLGGAAILVAFLFARRR